MFSICSQVVVVVVFLHISTLSNAERQRRGTGPTVIPLTDHEKMEIVKHHNDLRRLSGAANMRYMTWDSELAWLAEGYSKKCHFNHNDNRKHSRGWSVGENIYATSGKMKGSDTINAIQAWYNEIDYFSDGSRTCQRGKKCGHYTQIVWATTFKVGCALVTCVHMTGVNWNTGGSMFLCNYATAGNIVSGSSGLLLPLYEKGPYCSKCGDDDYCRNHLCANSARDFIEEPEINGNQETGNSSHTAFIAVIVVLCIVIAFLIALLIFRQRLAKKYGVWKGTPHNPIRFSNQTTPASSAFNTPRHSVAGTNLHGISKLTAADISTPLEKLKAEERQTSSAPTTPRRGYIKGTATPPKVAPPVRPPPIRA